jgi:small GTP-binding protein
MANYIPVGKPASVGEIRVFDYLREHLPDDYTLFSNIVFNQGGRPFEIDGIILGRYAIYVIEIKNFSGDIIGDKDYWQIMGTDNQVRHVINPINATKHRVHLFLSYLRKYQRTWKNIRIQGVVCLSGLKKPILKIQDDDPPTLTKVIWYKGSEQFFLSRKVLIVDPYTKGTTNDITSLHEELKTAILQIYVPSEIYKNAKNTGQLINLYSKNYALNESKLLIIGQGSVGKTSIVEQILHNTFDPIQAKTEGISISQWIIYSGWETNELEPVSIKLNIWDFGGQEIMHATHQFFLTKRSLYLLVLDSRLTQEENRVEYWLKIIQSFGGESPVLIVGNKIDQHPLDIDRTGLQKKYPNIVGILETSAATGAGIEELKAAIAEQVNNLPHVRDLLPETWFTVKTKLEGLGRESNFITHDKYLELCAENEVTDETSQRTLIGFLHDLGVVLHFQDDPRLEALGILNPQWVTNGVYKILNSHTLFQNKGALTTSMLDEILNLPEYPRGKRLFIVDMMKKFELCYDIEADKIFLVPDLLPKDEPYTGEWDGALAFQIHYNVLPTSIISRFIVRMNAFVHKTVWRSGAVLKREGNTALVKADTEDKKIYIWLNGDEKSRREFLAVIRAEFAAIHKTIAKIEAKEKVPVPDSNVVIDFDHLLKLERKGILDFLPEGMDDPINVRELLNGVEKETNRLSYVGAGDDSAVIGRDVSNSNIINAPGSVINIAPKPTRKRKS